MSVFESQMWSVKSLTADNTDELFVSAIALAKELLEMDKEGAIELDSWPNAKALIRAVLE